MNKNKNPDQPVDYRRLRLFTISFLSSFSFMCFVFAPRPSYWWDGKKIAVAKDNWVILVSQAKNGAEKDKMQVY